MVQGAVRGAGKKSPDNTDRAFGGINVVMYADFWQLSPVSGTFLASNPLEVPAGSSQQALQMFLQTGPDSVRSFWQLTELMRCDDVWYNSFLGECRVGNLSIVNYSYFHGLSTLTSPCMGKCRCSKDIEKVEVIGPYRKSWKARFLSGYADMGALQKSAEGECVECRAERTKRHRVLTDSAGSRIPELHGKPFDSAPALYTFNVPRAFATNLRAREYAKHRGVQLSWCYARDVPCLPEDRELPQKRYDAKMFSLLRFHDQQTRHLPNIYGLAVGMPVRLTDTIDRSRQLYRGRKGVIHGWSMAPNCIPHGNTGGESVPIVQCDRHRRILQAADQYTGTQQNMTQE